MRKALFFLLILPLFSFSQRTDTIGFMHYNVLNYRNITSFCTVSNNSPSAKEGYMNTITGYLLPDILTVNELAADGGTAARRLLDNALNKDGRKFYKSCAFSANSSLANMLYYNQNKFALLSQDKILRALDNSFLVRQIDVYTLYYLDTKKLEKGDTTKLTVYVTHFKAGSTSSDRDEREDMAQAIMEYHEENYDRQNYIIAGDFNIRSASETSYLELTEHSNSAIRFLDPITAKGSWNGSSLYSFTHTQSTRSSSNGCASGGGLDDRFDFILCGREVLDGSYGMEYIADSYEAVGNDGKKLDKDINNGTNTSVPASVLDALYNMSDHLPVYMQIAVNRSLSNIDDLSVSNYLMINNPVYNQVKWKLQYPMNGEFQLLDIQGNSIIHEDIRAASDWKTYDVSELTSGVYYAVFTSETGEVVRRKLLKL